eukprot:m.122044 g.122044  ORF g.122044 m.122044 type:complete len:822 (+) comp9387_c1_seq3:100-2565(+)
MGLMMMEGRSRCRVGATPVTLAMVAIVTLISSSPVSFATMKSSPLLQPGVYFLNSTLHPSVMVRHCDFQLFATLPSPLPQDFLWDIVPALNGVEGAISFQSINYPTYFITLITDAEVGRLGVVTSPNTDDASFQVNSTSENVFSFQTLSKGNLKGGFMGLNGELHGDCSTKFQSPASDIVVSSSLSQAAIEFILTKDVIPPTSISLNPTSITHGIDPLFMGCHSDTGFVHQGRGFFSQLVFGESFEDLSKFEDSYWILSNNSEGSATITAGGMHGQSMLQVKRITAGSSMVGAFNKGLGNEGFFIEEKKLYDGYFFVSAPSNAEVVVALVDTRDNSTMASQTTLVKGGNWTQVFFNFTASHGTNCVDGSKDPSVHCGNLPNPSHICVRCFGQLFVGLNSVGTVNIDYVFLQPGEWARVNSLPVLKSTVEVLQSIGVTAIRQGGSFTIEDYYSWKNWRGAPWTRPSVGATWGDELISGWGPFEMIDMCEAAGFEPIITVSADSGSCCSPEDMADLVEYCYGNENTTWGSIRHKDGHPDPFHVRFFELGNEQYNSNYPSQVAAMEERAESLGMGKTLFYMNPNNGHWLNSSDAQAVENLNIGDHAVMDLHVGAGGAVEVAENMFNSHPTYTMGAVNAETNAATHHMQRALQEAADLNDWFSCSEEWCNRLHFRTASFCSERSGHFDNYDQGITFFLPNMSWIQPPGYVHQMIHQSWLPFGVNVTTNTTNSDLSISAQVNENSSQLVVRVVNSHPQRVVVTFNVGTSFKSTVSVLELYSLDVTGSNTPSNPTAISPSARTLDLSQTHNTLTLQPNSVTSIFFSK